VGIDGVRGELVAVTFATRLEAVGVVGLALAGMTYGAAAVAGLVPADPPEMVATAVAVSTSILAFVKTAVMAAALVRYLLSRA
jgi:hypothetical protein